MDLDAVGLEALAQERATRLQNNVGGTTKHLKHNCAC